MQTKNPRAPKLTHPEARRLQLIIRLSESELKDLKDQMGPEDLNISSLVRRKLWPKGTPRDKILRDEQ